MNRGRLEWKVGLFVLVGLVLMAGLVILFSKGLAAWHPTYELRLRSPTVGGLLKNASVLMAGVPVGKVGEPQLAEDGRSVIVPLRILGHVRIHRDARFVIEQAGFLGDQYVAIIPTANAAPLLEPGDEVVCDAPFNLQETARAAAGFLSRIDETAQRLNHTLQQVQQLLLNEETLTNMAETLDNFHQLSRRARATMDSLHDLVTTNTAPVALTVSNMAGFSAQLTDLGRDLQGVLATNAPDVQTAIKNIETASRLVTELLNELHAGRGLAGQLLKNEQIAADVAELTHNLAVTSSNLNTLGLWRVLWRPRPTAPPESGPAPRPLHAPKHPFP